MAELLDDRPPHEAGFIIQYDLQPDDLACMMADRERHVLPRVKTVAYYILLSFFAFSLCVGLWVWSKKGFEEATVLLALSSFFIVAIPLARTILPKYLARYYHRKLALHGTAIETKFASSGIHSAGGGISSDMEWSTVIKITRTPRHFFFWINKVQAIIIPLRALPDGADQHALWVLAERNFAGAKQ